MDNDIRVVMDKEVYLLVSPAVSKSETDIVFRNWLRTGGLDGAAISDAIRVTNVSDVLLPMSVTSVDSQGRWSLQQGSFQKLEFERDQRQYERDYQAYQAEERKQHAARERGETYAMPPMPRSPSRDDYYEYSPDSGEYSASFKGILRAFGDETLGRAKPLLHEITTALDHLLRHGFPAAEAATNAPAAINREVLNRLVDEYVSDRGIDWVKEQAKKYEKTKKLEISGVNYRRECNIVFLPARIIEYSFAGRDFVAVSDPIRNEYILGTPPSPVKAAPPPPPAKSKTGLLAGVGAAAAVLIGIGAFAVLHSGKHPAAATQTAGTATPVPTQADLQAQAQALAAQKAAQDAATAKAVQEAAAQQAAAQAAQQAAAKVAAQAAAEQAAAQAAAQEAAQEAADKEAQEAAALAAAQAAAAEAEKEAAAAQKAQAAQEAAAAAAAQKAQEEAAAKAAQEQAAKDAADKATKEAQEKATKEQAAKDAAAKATKASHQAQLAAEAAAAAAAQAQPAVSAPNVTAEPSQPALDTADSAAAPTPAAPPAAAPVATAAPAKPAKQEAPAKTAAIAPEPGLPATTYQDFSLGKVRLAANGTTDSKSAEAMSTAASAHDAKALSKTAVTSASGNDLGYYYLGVAAQQAGLNDAARTYYQLSLQHSETNNPPSVCSPRHQKTYQPALCHGIVLPSRAARALASLPAG